MKIAYFDCVGGIAGDMALASLISAGADKNWIVDKLCSLPINGWDLTVKKVEVGVFFGNQLTVNIEEKHPHRGLGEIIKIINNGDMPAEVKERAIKIFETLAKAEADVHGEPVENIHFHEVGAVDAIVDIVGFSLALHTLGIEKVYCSALPMGHGTVECRHGLIPLPAPAVVNLLKGIPTYGVDIEGETVTPTGAALLRATATAFGKQPMMTWQFVGCGVGSRQSELPNITRVFIGEACDDLADNNTTDAAVIETNIDDMSPEMAGYLMDRLLESGALDVFYTPVLMKKNRPGYLITVLCELNNIEPVKEVLFNESTTFGLRFSKVSRECLARKWDTVETAYGQVRVKLGERAGKVKTSSPEFEDCRKIAESAGLPLREVYQLAKNLWQKKSETQQ